MAKTITQIRLDYYFQPLPTTVKDLLELLGLSTLYTNLPYKPLEKTISEMYTAIGSEFLIKGQPFFMSDENAVLQAINYIAANGTSYPPSLVGLSTGAFFGDSITKADGIAAGQSFRELVATALAVTGTNLGVNSTPMQNTFTAGGSAFASNGRDRYSSTLTGGNKKDFVVIAYGSNDLGRDREYLTYPGFNIVKFVEDYRQVVLGLIAAGYAADKIVLCSLPFISDYENGSWTGGDVALHERYNAWIKQIAYENGTLFADTYKATKDGGGAALLQGDGVHPTAAGHAVIANAILSATFVMASVIAETDLVKWTSAIDFSLTDTLSLSTLEINKAYDISGNENHATNTNVGARPVTGGLIGTANAADFDGADYLTYGKVALGNTGFFCDAGQAFTVVCVGSPDTAGAFLSKAGATSALRTFMLTAANVGGTGPATHLRGTGTNTIYNTGVGVDVLMIFTWDGTEAKLYANGGAPTVVPVGAAADESAGQNIIMGGRTNGTGFFLNGRIGAMKIADTLLTKAQLNVECAALAAKNGLSYTPIP